MIPGYTINMVMSFRLDSHSGPRSCGQILILSIALLVVACSCGARRTSLCQVVNPRCEYLADPVGLETQKPRFSWQLSDSRRGARQTAYRIVVSSKPRYPRRQRADVWDSGKVSSSQSTLVEYGGPPLSPATRYYWSVRVWDMTGQPVDLRSAASFEMGLSSADWKAQWIGKQSSPIETTESLEGIRWIWYPEGNPYESAPTETRYFRRSFDLPADKEVRTAYLYGGADDVFTLYANGETMTSSNAPYIFSPVSIANQLKAGKNVIAVEAKNNAGSACLGALINIVYTDGSTTRIASDEQWKSSKLSPIGWNTPEYDDSAWEQAMVIATPGEPQWGTPKLLLPGGPALYLRKEFKSEMRVTRARIYATALGAYELRLNGQRVGDQILAPGWTNYSIRLPYQVYDVTSQVHPGMNALGAILGDGWYASGLFRLQRWNFGPPPTRLLVQLVIEYRNGSSQTVVSDSSWKVSEGAILRSEICAGESYDARLEKPGWDSAGYSTAGWKAAALVPGTSAILNAQQWQPIKATQEIDPVAVTNPVPGRYVFDMGQNMAGWVRLKAAGGAGTRIQLRFAETLNPDGTIFRTNLKRAEATDTYICNGSGAEVYEPHFTYHGFRYVEIQGFPGTPSTDTLKGVVVHTNAALTGEFTCSDPMVNQVWKNAFWSQRANLMSVPTDCPQRDERLGWMGDAEVFWPTACYNMEMAPLSLKWMRDVADVQNNQGSFRDISPMLESDAKYSGSPGWADAGIIIPWVVYQQYGDKRIIEENYPAMKRWLSYLESNNPNHLWINARGRDYGDWLHLGGETPKDLVATAIWAYDALLMSKMADATGQYYDVATYTTMYQKIRAAFQTSYVQGDGKVGIGTQAGYALALRAGLIPDSVKDQSVQKLRENIASHSSTLTTGFLGTPCLLPALSDNGQLATAYQLLLNRSMPSWGWMVDKGATTMWEGWDWDGVPTTATPSLNHYAFGCVGDWLYRSVAGIATDEAQPGFRQIVIRPRPGTTLTSASGSYVALAGKISSAWSQSADGTFQLAAVIPPNTTAVIWVPAESQSAVTESGVAAGTSSGVSFLRMEDGCAVYSVGAGQYQFVSAKASQISRRKGSGRSSPDEADRDRSTSGGLHKKSSPGS